MGREEAKDMAGIIYLREDVEAVEATSCCVAARKGDACSSVNRGANGQLGAPSTLAKARGLRSSTHPVRHTR